MGASINVRYGIPARLFIHTYIDTSPSSAGRQVGGIHQAKHLDLHSPLPSPTTQPNKNTHPSITHPSLDSSKLKTDPSTHFNPPMPGYALNNTNTERERERETQLKRREEEGEEKSQINKNNKKSQNLCIHASPTPLPFIPFQEKKKRYMRCHARCVVHCICPRRTAPR